MSFLYILLLLLLLNFIPVWFSKRKKRYGLFSIPLFAIAFSAYWVLHFLLSEGVLTENPRLQPSNTRDPVANSVALRVNEVLLKKRDEDTAKIKKNQLGILSLIIRIAEAQALVVVIFSLIALLTINNRTKYYGILLGVFSVMFLFCWFLESNINSFV